MTRRRILFITTDQQRYDSLGCNGGEIARTPVADALAARGIPFIFATGYDGITIPPRYADVIRCQKPVDPARLARSLFGAAGRR